MNRYVELWGWVCEVFGDRSFTIDEFRAEFPSPDPAKVVYDLARLNLITRLETGVYRSASPLDFSRKMVKQSMSKENLLALAPAPFAYSNDDAVRIWTDGYYWTGFTAGYKPVHIEIRNADVGLWEHFFRGKDADYAFEGDRKTLFGLVFILHRVHEVQFETRDGVPVIPLVRVMEYCLERRGIYEPAVTYLRKKFGAKLSRDQNLAL
jgi:hypothetical protein